MEQEEILGDPEVTEYLLQITQPSQYGYAKSRYRFAVTSGSPSKYHALPLPLLQKTQYTRLYMNPESQKESLITLKVSNFIRQAS